MESSSEMGACADYDVHGGRLVVMTSRGRHEIQVRPQVHRLVRYMAERNAASAGASVLCSNDELMNAVWGEEPMHTHTELARLVWELRRELEPLGATDSRRQRETSWLPARYVYGGEIRRIRNGCGRSTGSRQRVQADPGSSNAIGSSPRSWRWPSSLSRASPWRCREISAEARRRDVDECRRRHVRRSDRERARAVGSRTTRNRRSVERRVQLLDFARRSRTSNRQRRRQPPEHPRATRQHPGADGRRPARS